MYNIVCILLPIMSKKRGMDCLNIGNETAWVVFLRSFLSFSFLSNILYLLKCSHVDSEKSQSIVKRCCTVTPLWIIVGIFLENFKFAFWTVHHVYVTAYPVYFAYFSRMSTMCCTSNQINNLTHRQFYDIQGRNRRVCWTPHYREKQSYTLNIKLIFA